MRILFISTTYPTPRSPHQGAFNRGLVNALRQVGNEVKVVAPVPWTLLWQSAGGKSHSHSKTKSQSILVEEVPDESYPIYFYPPFLGRSLYHLFYSWSIRRSVNQILQSFHPDFVLGYWAHPDGKVAVEIAHRCRIPGIIIVGGSDVRILAQKEPRRHAIQTSLQSADRIVAMSHDLRQCMVDLGIQHDKISVVYRGVDLNVFTPGSQQESRRKLALPKDSTILLWVGRLQEVKNPLLFVETVELLKRSLPQLQAFMIGDGPLRSRIEREIESRELGGLLKIVGSVAHHELADWYRSSDRIVLTSHSEGVPNVLLESIACGIPFIATNVGGIPEIASPNLDRLVPADNAIAFRDAILDSLGIHTSMPRPFVPVCQTDFAHRFMEAIAVP